MDKKQFHSQQAKQFISKQFNQSLIPSLFDFISIPNLSRSYDQQFASNGLLQKAANHIKQWVEKLNIKGLTIQIIQHQGYTPILFTEIKGDVTDKTILLYGHFDKQPPMEGWDQGKGATIPIIQNGKLYGRGGADDGYSTYSSMLAIKAIQQQGQPIPRCVMITEGDEESGDHIDHYIDKLKTRIGNPEIIFCLDSGVYDYQRLWLTNSLRGYISGHITIEILKQGVHSGDGSGIIPSCFRIVDILLNRIENIQNSKIIQQFNVHVPPNRYKQSLELANIIINQNKFVRQFPIKQGLQFVSFNQHQLILNRTWKSQLTITGISNYPSVEIAGNVLIPKVCLKLSLRIPPTLDAKKSSENLEKILTENPPFNAKITFQDISFGNGWNAPIYNDWLENAVNQSSKIYFGKQAGGIGEGGSIPLMGLLSMIWPKAQFIITGVLGPESNAHGPNEFLHINYTNKLTCAMSYIIAQVAIRK